MHRLSKASQDHGHLPLRGAEIALKEGIDIEQHQLVPTNEPRRKLQYAQPEVEGLVALACTLQQFLRQSLRIVEEVNRREVDVALRVLLVLSAHHLLRDFLRALELRDTALRL